MKRYRDRHVAITWRTSQRFRAVAAPRRTPSETSTLAPCSMRAAAAVEAVVVAAGKVTRTLHME